MIQKLYRLSITLSDKSFVCDNNSSIGALPAPETDWYVDATILFILYKSWRGLSATTKGITEQLAFATIFFFFMIF